MKRITLAALTALLAWGVGAPTLAGVNIAPKPLAMATGKPPNILLIPDTSESMQEDTSGRLALDRSDPKCVPGPNMDADHCPAGARSPLSKASIVKDVGLLLIDNYRDNVNMGLMSYQQHPASQDRGDFNSGGTVRWHLVERAIDVRFSTDSNPSWYQPNHNQSWDSDIKRFRTQHPYDEDIYLFFNDAIPGYAWTPTNQPLDLDNNVTGFYCRTDRDGGGQQWDCHYDPSYEHDEDSTYMTSFGDLRDSGAVEDDIPGIGSGLWFADRNQRWNVFLVDSQRQRGIDSWGRRAVFLQTNQKEWRTTTAPGKGYLHVPIRGNTGDPAVDDAHWAALTAKLQPQRHDWNPDAMTDPAWPLIAAGLTPLEGTMQTARDYFEEAGSGTSNTFGPDQGWNDDLPDLPESCDVNAAVWITDGLPSVAADGTGLGDDPPGALDDAADAIEDFHNVTGADVHIVGFALPAGVEDIPKMPDDPLDRLAAAGGTEKALMAEDEQGLIEAMNEIFQQIIADARSEFSSLNSGAVMRLDSIGFRTLADPEDWTGDVVGERNPDGSATEIWRASEEMPAWEDRGLITSNGDFEPGNADLLAEMIEILGGDDSDQDDVDQAIDIINYVRGDASNEQRNNGNFQDRSSLIGAVVGSEPALQRPINHGWDRVEELRESYQSHVSSKSGRRNVVYVGSNAGVVHAIDAESGNEIWGYVPRAVWPRLPELADPGTDFVYTVDGSMRVVDAYWDGGWKTVLLGGLGAGGKGLFAIDVTNPNNPTVLWEVTPEDLGGDGDDLGFTFAAPGIARIDDGSDTGEFVVVAGNGYGSENNDSRLLVFDESGNLTENIAAGTGSSGNPNGLSTARIAMDRPDEHYSRWVYAGDLHGSLWRFDLNSPSSSADEIHSTSGPITAAPQTSYPPFGNGFVVSFGTGKFFETGDNSTTDNQRFYVIYDLDPENGTPGGDLTSRSFGGSNTGEREDIDLEDYDGWFVEFSGGERVLTQPRVVQDMVLFSTYQPIEDPCAVGGINAGYLLRVGSAEGAFGDDYTGRIGDIEGAPAGVGFTVRERPLLDSDGDPVTDPDTGEVIADGVDVAIRIGDHEEVLEGTAGWAEDLAEGRRQNWMQVR
ncbi:PQQ-binding-like beta-propeller repeat protein [Wenzhouxiangella sp. AB-CW3]|uniref:pilus assembly protein n=1 Tax=Wenzhouxiangella sp. AB-CW3 TaxID=2771012 RepID=UPI00168B2541|nr:PilC/PilY family type IV pilus protein [Wenzhouxiangella sp. AB-CW3]QOC22789.1 PQQ-binding-like beta-propeller repeat protein [Wenzhouxiangella sp. AB-CW3]